MSVDSGGLLAEFEGRFGRRAEVLAVAPGRVNLVGEHTDYNGGFVLPVAIDRTVAVAAAARPDGRLRAWSRDFGECDEFDLLGVERANGWRNYVRGVAWAIQESAGGLRGADLVLAGNIPLGAGLSSSAAVEVATGAALAAIVSASIKPRDLALLARRAENEFVGVACGIMDQFAAALSLAGHALLIDCRSLETTEVPLMFEEADPAIAVIDSKVPRRLEEAPYNRRRQECAEAASHLALPSLREADEPLLEERKAALPGSLYRRARHVIRENGRVLEAVRLLRVGDLRGFGELMYRSHGSLRDDFDVSCPELDLLVELASRSRGVVGARLTGAGFGGSTVNLVQREALADFEESVVKEYQRQTGLAAEMHLCRSVDGVRGSHV